MLASGSNDNTIKLWNVESRTEVATLKGHSDSVIPLHLIVRELCWHPDLDDRTIKLWNVESRTEVATFCGKGHSNSGMLLAIPLHLIVRELCWHPDLVIEQ